MSECRHCGNTYCNADEFDRELCWFYHEQRLIERGRLPRDISSVNNKYLALVVATNIEAKGDDYDGFPTKDDMSQEEIERALEEAPITPRHIE